MNWPFAAVIIAIVVVTAIPKRPTVQEIAQTELGKACVASGQEWVKSWGDYECRRAQ